MRDYKGKGMVTGMLSEPATHSHRQFFRTGQLPINTPYYLTTREYIEKMMDGGFKQYQPGTKPHLVKTAMGWAVVNTPVAIGVQKYAKLWSQAWSWCRQQSEVNHE